jgi:RNA polymerase sigma-70 factor (ECF subfamily)
MLESFATDVDAELMLRARNHDDSESFSLLLGRNRNLVVQYLTRVVQNRAVAEELAQDVFIRIYRSRHCYEPSARFSTWLYRIATNVALNHLRDQKRHLRDISLDVQETDRVRREAPDQGPLIEDELVREARARQIRRAIQALPPKQRTAVILHKYQELDYAQIGTALGCTPAAVKALMFRAYETLRVRLRYLVPRSSASPMDQLAISRPESSAIG